MEKKTIATFAVRAPRPTVSCLKCAETATVQTIWGEQKEDQTVEAALTEVCDVL